MLRRHSSLHNRWSRRLGALTAGAFTVAALCIPGVAQASDPHLTKPKLVTQTFGHQASTQLFTVPHGVTKLMISVTGAQGGRGGDDGNNKGGTNGYHGVVSGTVAVAENSVVTVAVGAGGANGADSKNYLGSNSASPANGGTNPLGGYSGGTGGVAGSVGTSGFGGGGGGATVVAIGDATIVAGGGGGGGGSGNGPTIQGRSAEAAFVAPGSGTTSGAVGAGVPLAGACGSQCDGGGAGGGGGGTTGGSGGTIEYGAGSTFEWFGYGGFPGLNSTGGISGLTASYQFYAGNGGNGSVTIAYIDGPPSPPRELGGTLKDGEAGDIVTLHWGPPLQQGRAEVTGYVVQYSVDGSSFADVPADHITYGENSATITDVAGDTTTTFRVVATSDYGSGPASTSICTYVPEDDGSAPEAGEEHPAPADITCTADAPIELAGAPSGVTLAPGNGSIGVAFTAGSVPADDAIIGYQYSLNGGGWIDSGAFSSPFTIPGLDNGTPYRVALRAVTLYGAGAASSPAGPATPVSYPDFPDTTTISAFAAGAGAATILWSAANDNGSRIVNYTVSAFDAENGGTVAATCSTTGQLNCTLNGLGSGTYWLSIQTQNGVGYSPRSAPRVKLDMAAMPGAPTGLTAAPGDGMVALTWTAPSSGSISGYDARYSEEDGASWTMIGDHAGTSLSVNGLDNTTTYTFEVRAKSGIANGPWSSRATATPLPAGTAPILSAPSRTSDGFTTTITEYDDALDYTVSSTAGLASRSGAIVTVTGLTPDTSATVTVVAQQTGRLDASADVTGTSLKAGTAPSLTKPTRTEGGFTVKIDNFDETTGATYVLSVAPGTATRDGDTISVTGLADGQTASLAVQALKDGYTARSATVSERALDTGAKPTYSTPLRTTDGFTLSLSNFDPHATYTLTTTAGAASRAGSDVTLSGLDAGSPATITISVTKPGYTAQHVTVTESALLTGVPPALSPAVRTATGFTFAITNAGTYTSGTAFTAAVSHGPSGSSVIITGSAVTITGLSAGQTATITIAVDEPGHTEATGSLTGQALWAGTAPTFGAVTRTKDGFTTSISNFDPDATYTTTGSARITRSGSSLTVTGVTPGASASIGVTVAKAGFTTASASIAANALDAGAAPAIASLTQIDGGFNAAITDYDPTATYAVSVSGASGARVSRLGGTIIVTGLKPGDSVIVTIVVTRSGAAAASQTISFTMPANAGSPEDPAGGAQPPDVPEQRPGTGAVNVDGQAVSTTITGDRGGLTVSDGSASMRAAAIVGGQAAPPENNTVVVPFTGTISVNVDGFAPATSVQVWAFSTPTLLGTFIVRPGTDGFITVVLPPHVLVGEHTLVVKGTNTLGKPITISAPMRVTPLGSTVPGPESSPRTDNGNLGYTGFDTDSYLRLATLLLLVGAGLSVTAKRHRKIIGRRDHR